MGMMTRPGSQVQYIALYIETFVCCTYNIGIECIEEVLWPNACVVAGIIKFKRTYLAVLRTWIFSISQVMPFCYLYTW